MRTRYSLPLLFLISACTADAGSPSEPFTMDSLDASAVVQGIVGSDSLTASVSLHNRSSARAELGVLLYCPVVVRLYDLDNGDLAYDGGEEPCPRAGLSIEIPPGGQETLQRFIPLRRLRDVGVPTGEYRAVAIVTTSRPRIEVEAGRVDIP